MFRKWIKEANKIGKYYQSYRGYRIYYVVISASKTETMEIDGKIFEHRTFEKGKLIAVNKPGNRIERYSLSEVGSAIDVEIFRLKAKQVS